ncbi:PREDICTED: uncharacterized protein LOC109586252 [Amphimedon queenslandica]|uniref:Uncharacterized protein n=1 Tax=Amphimedon queenslandica TaxID=400682 RepID=A0AAN0JLV9_AMPQE|nr:PREDICTED: uncharacterized protein LOC109586252 [Amphimedon queenslandica]|eukprot:XP_019857985.1 PREDICTED: uncharacterized protein LOC109586252 [Amphimedon queenslandica]
MQFIVVLESPQRSGSHVCFCLIRMSTMILNLIFLLLLQYIDCADINVHPVSINTTLNSTVVFSCEAIADDLSFRVNNTPATNIGVIAKGFSETVFNNGGTREAELEAMAYDYNNNTEVKCRAINDEPFVIVFSIIQQY